jgi:hypothetical protein
VVELIGLQIYGFRWFCVGGEKAEVFCFASSRFVGKSFVCVGWPWWRVLVDAVLSCGWRERDCLSFDGNCLTFGFMQTFNQIRLWFKLTSFELW